MWWSPKGCGRPRHRGAQAYVDLTASQSRQEVRNSVAKLMEIQVMGTQKWYEGFLNCGTPKTPQNGHF